MTPVVGRAAVPAAGALHPYAVSLRTRTPLALHLEGSGQIVTVDVAPWLLPADDVDLAALARLAAPVLDIGCGPGRVVEAVTAAGGLCLGIDVVPAAIALAAERGLNVLRRDVYAPLPLEGRWSSAVLLDGNIGIGGDPTRLLARVAVLLRPGGRVLVETHVDDTLDEVLTVRFCHEACPTGPPFRWARVGRRALRRHAARGGLEVLDTWRDGDRSFALLGRARPTQAGGRES